MQSCSRYPPRPIYQKKYGNVLQAQEFCTLTRLASLVQDLLGSGKMLWYGDGVPDLTTPIPDEMYAESWLTYIKSTISNLSRKLHSTNFTYDLRILVDTIMGKSSCCYS